MDHRILYAVFLLLLCHVQGSTVVTQVFVQNGSDVHLDVNTSDVPKGFDLLTWKFKENPFFVKFYPDKPPTISEIYIGRVEAFAQNYSVKLKNLQDSDSGVYEARVTADKLQTVAEYVVTVQAPVSPVDLTVDSVFNSSDSCNITVSCRTQDFKTNTTFTCVNQICKEGEKTETTPPGGVLRVYLENNSIRCNHSNQVSWHINEGPPKIQDLCRPLSKEPPNGANNVLIAVGSTVGSLLLLLVILLCIRKIIKEKKQPIDNTVYDVPQERSHTENPISTTYATVQFHKGPEGSTTIEDPRPKMPETIYAQVNRAEKSNSASITRT